MDDGLLEFLRNNSHACAAVTLLSAAVSTEEKTVSPSTTTSSSWVVNFLFFHLLDHLLYDFHPLHNILYSLGQPGTVSDKAEQACFVFSGPIYRLTDRWLRTAVFTPLPLLTFSFPMLRINHSFFSGWQS